MPAATNTNLQQELTIVEARARLTRLPEELSEGGELARGAITVTRRGKPVLAVMTHDLYESIIETMEIMSDPDLMGVLRQSIQDVQDGRTVPWEQVKAEFGL